MKRATAFLAIHFGIAALVPLLGRTTFGAGPLIWLLLGILLLCWVAMPADLARLLNHRAKRSAWATRAGLVVGSVIGVCLIFEVTLALQSALVRPAHGEAGQMIASLPPEWARREVEIEGARFAYYWHGILHVYNEDRMRRTEPFPEKRDDRFRVMVVGDSLTYGEGVEAGEAYPSRLQRMLERDYSVEVLNLGVNGSSSEDVLRVVERFTPLLKPDLVVYGICQNDFLPHNVLDYASNRAYPVPLPSGFKRFLMDHTRVGNLLSERYDRLLMRLGLRRDLWDDILLDFRNYKTRFARDLAGINRFVTERGLPPTVAMVLDQYPKLDGRRKQITEIAKQAARDAGMSVVDTTEYYDRFDGQRLDVSRWEGHPNREAHRIFAEYLAPLVLQAPGLDRYLRGGDGDG